MIASNSLPLYVKRTSAVFLMLLFSYFLFSSENPDNPPDDIKNSIRTVVIDAGHGGKDSGAVGKKAQEKDIALNISMKLGKLIEENIKDVNVIYTRTTDVFVELYQRANIANKAEADLFISIHVNSNSKSSPYGTSSHVLGLHRTGENFDVAITENSVILLEDDYETTYQGFDPTSLNSYIIFSVMQNIHLKQSIEFASYVQDEFREKSKRKDRGVVQQGLLVLARTAMPGVLIETGFISNAEEEEFLMTDYGQDLIASGIYRAFKQYKTRIEDNSNFSIDAPEEITDTPLKTSIDTDLNEQYADKIVFMVQLASSKNLVETTASSFKGYEDVKVVKQGKWYKYAIGSDLTYHEALERCTEVKRDYPDAFVIAIKNNIVVPLNEALQEINR